MRLRRSKPDLPSSHHLDGSEGEAALALPAPDLGVDEPGDVFGEVDSQTAGKASEEHRLVEAARAGDGQAVEALYRTYYGTIYRYSLLRVGVPAAAEDVASQVFLGMIRGLPRFRWQGKPFVAWLYAIAQKQVALHHRGAARAPGCLELEGGEDLVADTVGPEATTEERERRVRLCSALRMLPASQREVVLLRYVLGLSLEETAAAIERSEGAVKQLQIRGLATLREVCGSRPEAF